MVIALIGICGLVVGALVTHLFTSRRDLTNLRRDMRTRYLVDAYRTISGATGRDLQRSPDDARAFEQGISDIQLFGSRKQVDMARQIAREMTDGGEADPDGLLMSLRDDLRAELELDPVSLKLVHIRVVSKANDD